MTDQEHELAERVRRYATQHREHGCDGDPRPWPIHRVPHFSAAVYFLAEFREQRRRFFRASSDGGVQEVGEHEVLEFSEHMRVTYIGHLPSLRGHGGTVVTSRIADQPHGECKVAEVEVQWDDGKLACVWPGELTCGVVGRPG